MYKVFIVLFFLGFSIPNLTLGNEMTGPKLENPGSLSSNLRWTIDLSSRAIVSTDNGDLSMQHFIGLDLHKVFTGPNGDWGTLLFQPYLVKLQDVEPTPFPFDDPDDTKLTWRMVNFNYTGLSRGRFNIRVGHFEVPFGLEQNIDTHGTLRQYTFKDRGIKVDWGATINGVLPDFEYEIALSRGSGLEYSDNHDPYLFSGRIGSSSSNNLIGGLSFLNGEILGPAGTVKRSRLGLDIAWYTGPFELLLEASDGEDENAGRRAVLGELSYRSPMQDLHLYMQGRYSSHEKTGSWDDNSMLTLGINWSVGQKLEISAQLNDQLDRMTGQPDTGNFIAQLRYRF